MKNCDINWSGHICTKRFRIFFVCGIVTFIFSRGVLSIIDAEREFMESCQTLRTEDLEFIKKLDVQYPAKDELIKLLEEELNDLSKGIFLTQAGKAMIPSEIIFVKIILACMPRKESITKAIVSE